MRLLTALIGGWSILMAQVPSSGGLPLYGHRIVNVYPHDAGAFTQALQYLDGYVYEATRLNGRASIRKATPEAGKALHQRTVPGDVFGDGITVRQNDLSDLTR